ncbi:MAG: XdhC family protein, partial [Anaerolineales bacterium]|nr:XdhC family protein [Anaerolineales bacterium]
MKEIFKETNKLLSDNQQVVIATVVRTKGSTPQKPGAKLLVRKDGSGVGTLGGGCVEGDIWYASQELLNHVGPTQFR